MTRATKKTPSTVALLTEALQHHHQALVATIAAQVAPWAMMVGPGHAEQDAGFWRLNKMTRAACKDPAEARLVIAASPSIDEVASGTVPDGLDDEAGELLALDVAKRLGLAWYIAFNTVAA